MEIKKLKFSKDMVGDPIGAGKGDKIEEKIHPLLENKIVDKIFRLIFNPLKKADKGKVTVITRKAKKLRLVCKLWKERSTTIFRELRPPIKFKIIPEYNEADWDNEEDYKSLFDNYHNLPRFIETMRNSSLIPVISFVIVSPEFGKEGQQQVYELLKLYGSEIVNFELQLETMTVQADINQQNSGLLSLPNLKTLKVIIEAFDCSPSEPEQVASSLLGLILKCAQNLEHLSLRLYINSYYQSQKECLELFRLIPESVKNIVIELPGFMDSYLEILCEKRIQLENCWITFSANSKRPHSEDIFRRFFELQSETLKYLTWPISNSLLPSERFPDMKELLELRVDQFGTAPPVSFPTTFPKLKVLDLSYINGDAAAKLLLHMRRASTVEKLYFPLITTSPQLVKKLAYIFPSVKKLIALQGTILSEIILHELFANFTGIEELYISLRFDKYEDGDSLLTGISREDCDNLRKMKNVSDVNIMELQKYPSILRLTKLTKLRMITFVHDKFTDISAHLVFLKMDSLKEIRSSHMFEKMSKKSLKKLGDKLKLSFDDSYNDRYEDEDETDDSVWVEDTSSPDSE